LFVKEGPLVYRLQTPGHIDKTYEVWVKGRLRQEHLEQVLKGVETPIGLLKAKSAGILGAVGPNTLVKVTLDEGKNRHIRRMFGALKDVKHNKFFKALDLTRISIGPVQLDLEPGQWRFLTDAETSSILDNV
jgi:23S rRNA pseudouridine2605 synthase